MSKYKYGDIYVGDKVLVYSCVDRKQGWYEVKNLSDEDGFNKLRSCHEIKDEDGFLINDGHLEGRGTFIWYRDVHDLKTSQPMKEIEI